MLDVSLEIYLIYQELLAAQHPFYSKVTLSPCFLLKPSTPKSRPLHNSKVTPSPHFADIGSIPLE